MQLWVPSEDDSYDEGWWDVLRRALRSAAIPEGVEPVDFAEFMFMGRFTARTGCRIWLYKHIHTRRYLNLDEDGFAYWYSAGKDMEHDRYLPYPHIEDAMEAADLFESWWRPPADDAEDPDAGPGLAEIVQFPQEHHDALHSAS